MRAVHLDPKRIAGRITARTNTRNTVSLGAKTSPHACEVILFDPAVLLSERAGVVSDTENVAVLIGTSPALS